MGAPSVLRGKEYGHYPAGFPRVGGVIRSVLSCGVVVVDLEEERLTVDREAAEIVLAVRVVLFRECLEIGCGTEGGRDEIVVLVRDPAGEDDLAARPVPAKGVVETADTKGALVRKRWSCGVHMPL